MDSNFQVRISADISDLQKSMGNLNVALNNVSKTADYTTNNIGFKFGKAAEQVSQTAKSVSSSSKKSFEDISSSIEKVGLDMNRARMATFAFGQVIRDAGFFQQSFGLGILAISNNIPILIDQLALASGVSAGFAAAISLVGSVLTAGLTVFAYWAQGVEREGGSVAGTIKKMALDSENALGQLVDYLSTPPASDILNRVIGGVMTGFEQIKALFNSFVNLAKAIWNRFGEDIEAVTDSTLGYLVDTLKNMFGISLGIIKAFTAVLSGDLSGIAEAVGNIFKSIANQIINILTGIVKVGSNVLGGFVGLFSKDAGNSIKSFGASVASFGQGLKFTSEQTKTANFNLKDWIKTIDVSTSSTKKAKDAKKELNKETEKSLELEANEFAVKMMSIEIAKNAEEAARKEADAISQLNDVMAQGLSIDPLGPKKQSGLITQLAQMIPTTEQIFTSLTQTMSSGFSDAAFTIADGIGQMIAGTMSMGDFGAAVLNSIGSFLSQMGKQMISFGIATLVYGKALKAIQSGNPGAMIAGGATLIAAGAALAVIGAAISGLAGGKKGSGASGSGGDVKASGSTQSVIPFANGGIVSGPTPALVGEYPGARSNPEVIAPLDKLQGIIAGSMGGGMAPASLETRISGNDLVILMNRATKNRKSYF